MPHQAKDLWFCPGCRSVPVRAPPRARSFRATPGAATRREYARRLRLTSCVPEAHVAAPGESKRGLRPPRRSISVFRTFAESSNDEEAATDTVALLREHRPIRPVRDEGKRARWIDSPLERSEKSARAAKLAAAPILPAVIPDDPTSAALSRTELATRRETRTAARYFRHGPHSG